MFIEPQETQIEWKLRCSGILQLKEHINTVKFTETDLAFFHHDNHKWQRNLLHEFRSYEWGSL